MPGSIRALLLIGGILLTACAEPPVCQVADGHPSDVSASAGCLIRDAGRLLVVRQRGTGKLNIPGGTSRSGESAQCTAHRETWEETGHSVQVGPLARSFDNGFRLYHCQIIAEGTQPLTGLREVSEILWVNVEEITQESWRYPEQVDAIRQLITQ